jgi:hypothetical protein
MIILDEPLIDRVHAFFLTEMMRVPDRSEAGWQWLALLCATRMLNSAEISIRAGMVNAASAEKVVRIDRPRPCCCGASLSQVAARTEAAT